MKVEISNKDLLKAITDVYSIVDRRNIKTILSNVMICTEKNKLYFFTTDLELFAKREVNASVGAQISTTVPIMPFYDIARGLGDDTKVCLIFENINGKVSKMVIKSDNAQFSLPCMDVQEFPDYQEEAAKCNFQMASNDLSYLLSATKHAISADDARYYLNGGYFHVVEEDNAKMIRVVSTDSHRLALAEVIVPENAALMPDVIMPTKCINELGKLLENNPGKIKVAVAKHVIKFEVGDTTLLSKLIDAKFPDYEKVIPFGNSKLLEVQVTNLIKAIDLVTTVSSAKPKSVKLKLQQNKLILSVNDKNNSSAVMEVPAIYNGSEVEISFNSRYLLDVLSIIEGTNAKIHFESGSSSVLLEDCKNNNCKFVLMPLRV